MPVSLPASWTVPHDNKWAQQLPLPAQTSAPVNRLMVPCLHLQAESTFQEFHCETNSRTRLIPFLSTHRTFDNCVPEASTRLFALSTHLPGRLRVVHDGPLDVSLKQHSGF